MAKQLFATMRIKHNGEYIEADGVIDSKRFTEAELTRLYERGAIKIVEVAEAKPATVTKAPPSKTTQELAATKAKAELETEKK